MNDKLKSIIENALSHISTQPAEIAKRELLREITEYVKDLQHFKDVHIGLWATDREPEDKALFFQIK